jgi:predicted ATP-dependent endonuclease of OLD family
MKLDSFRVQNYRSILDSGWVDVRDILTIVGKNESGKTSLLKALWKLKPFRAAPYSLDREWPRGKRKARSPAAPVVTAKFTFSDNEQKTLSQVDVSCEGLAGIEITKSYDGKHHLTYSPHNVAAKRSGASAFALLEAALEKAASKLEAGASAAVKSALGSAKGKILSADLSAVPAILDEVKSQFSAQLEDVGGAAAVQKLIAACDSVVPRLSESPWDLSSALVNKWIPTFVYMDDFLAFRGTAFLDQVKQRKDSNQLQEDDRTIIMIMEMAGLDLDQEVSKAGPADREQRILDMNDASQTLTNEIATRWSQKKYEVQFQADGNHFITFVKDESNKALVPLEERSKGFQWFFSFDMKFMYETDGEFENAVILLDEPGMHLHAAAQRDLLVRLKAYAANNQLIYTTHLPFMIDMDRLDNIWVAEDRGSDGTVVHSDWATADKDARFTLQAALGLSWAQSLFVGQRNLVVEGVTDFWFLTTLSTMLKAEGEAGLPEQLVITPAGGASKVAYVATLLAGQKLKVAALLDSDAEGLAARKQLVHNWLLKEGDVLQLADVLGTTTECALEDLFDENYYLTNVAAAYKKELNGETVTLPAHASGSIVGRLDKFFADKQIPFNKGRVAKLIMQDLATKSLGDLEGHTVDSFRKAIAAINSVNDKWNATP